MVKTGRKPSPQERAIEEKRAYWREQLSSGHLSISDFDPDTFDWRKYGEHFAPLSDEEWIPVWAHVAAASKRLPSEARVREFVDDAAFFSGWFVDYGEYRMTQADSRRHANELRRVLSKIANFRRDLTEFFRPPDWDYKDPFDPWGPWRNILPQLDDLTRVLEHQISMCEVSADSAKKYDPPSAAKPILDRWRGRLLLVWEKECKLPVRNSKHVRGFLLEAMRPYMPRAELTDRMAEYFIKRWIAGKVERPGPSPGQRLKAANKLPTS
jgi:hypothetical protein